MSPGWSPSLLPLAQGISRVGSLTQMPGDGQDPHTVDAAGEEFCRVKCECWCFNLLFCFGSCWMTQVFLRNASGPASYSVHHSKYTAVLFKARVLQGDSTFSSPAQPLLTINHTPRAAHPCGLAFCNHPSPSRFSWGSMNGSIRTLSLFLKPFGSFDHIKFVCTSGLLL